MGIVKTAGEWQVTLRENTNLRSIIDNGIEINGSDDTKMTLHV